MGKIIYGLGRYLLRNPKVLKPAEKTLEELLKPGGKELGISKGGAREGIRTLRPDEFGKIKSDLMDGAVEVPAPKSYEGRMFQRPDGSRFGLRESPDHGETIDVMKSLDESILENGYKLPVDQ